MVALPVLALLPFALLERRPVLRRPAHATLPRARANAPHRLSRPSPRR